MRDYFISYLRVISPVSHGTWNLYARGPWANRFPVCANLLWGKVPQLATSSPMMGYPDSQENERLEISSLIEEVNGFAIAG